MNHNEYNGWTNYETWAVNLWIDNDGGTERWTERASEILAQPWEPFYPSQDHARSCAHKLDRQGACYPVIFHATLAYLFASLLLMVRWARRMERNT